MPFFSSFLDNIINFSLPFLSHSKLYSPLIIQHNIWKAVYLVISFHHKQRGILGFTLRSISPTMYYLRHVRIFVYFSHFIVFHLPPVQILPHSLNIFYICINCLAFPLCLRVFVHSCCVGISSEKTNKKQQQNTIKKTFISEGKTLRLKIIQW